MWLRVGYYGRQFVCVLAGGRVKKQKTRCTDLCVIYLFFFLVLHSLQAVRKCVAYNIVLRLLFLMCTERGGVGGGWGAVRYSFSSELGAWQPARCARDAVFQENTTSVSIRSDYRSAPSVC